MTPSCYRGAFVLLLSLGFASLSPASRLDDPSDRPSKREAERLFQIEQMRIAASGRLIEVDDEIAAYLTTGFNTVVLYDTEESSGTGVGLLKSEQRIAFEVGFARAHGLHILLGKATEPVTPQVTDGGRTARLGVSGQRVRHAFAAAGTAAVSDEEIRDRLLLWDLYGHDQILGIFFLHDDAFLIRAGVERQLHLYSLAHETVPDWHVFGMIGEFGFGASPEEVARYFDPKAFDHLVVLMFPLNIGEVTGVRLDTVTAADPDASHTAASPPATFRARADIEIQATVGNAFVREIAGQERNRAVAYFLWDGSREGMFGLWQRPDWRAAAEDANRSRDERVGQIDP